MTRTDRWELGSAFPLTLGSGADRAVAFNNGRFFGSGRQALVALLTYGMREFGWKAVHLPTYYCPEVVENVTSVADVRRYEASPEGGCAEPAAGPDDVVVLVSYFGQPPGLVGTAAGARIIDATHDPLAPWLDDAAADYVVASLRKTLPLPDGGVVWSPRSLGLPDAGPATHHHLAGTADMLSAMALKAGYLAGADIDKLGYLELFARAEERIGGSTPGEMSAFSRVALATFPVGRWRRRRIENIKTFRAGLTGLAGMDVIPASFGVVLRFDSGELRDAIRSGITARNVYPAVLWDLRDQALPAHHCDLSGRLLFLHADFRWGRADMERAAAVVRAVHVAAFAR